MTAELRIAGVDEAGRGPLAGPVVVAAVVLDQKAPIAGLADSKKLTPRRREQLFEQICAHADDYAIVAVPADEIDQLNILRATLAGMSRAVAGLQRAPDQVLVDGNQLPELAVPARAIVGGDGVEPAISAASILAKVTRDRQMLAAAQSYPGYGFEGHKGYPTPAHLEALATLGPCPLHRRSFRPVQRAMESVRSG